MPAPRSARSATPTTSPPARSSTRSCRPTSTARSSGSARCSPPSGSRSWPSPATRRTTSSAPWPTRAPPRGLQSVIVSGDKDFYQLIGPGVALLNPGRGGPAAVDEIWVDESNAGRAARRAARRRWWTSWRWSATAPTTCPGVKGIGEKGAQKLLAEYGDLETILARAAEVTAKRTREALLAQADNGPAVARAGHDQARRAGRARRRRPRAAGAGPRRG